MSTEEATMDVADTYDRFKGRVERITNVGNAAGVLHWDQEVVMPEKGTPARAK